MYFMRTFASFDRLSLAENTVGRTFDYHNLREYDCKHDHEYNHKHDREYDNNASKTGFCEQDRRPARIY